MNLDGLRSSQAALMAGATSGSERTEWAAAREWLQQVEEDAREAQKAARLAADMALMGNFDGALRQAERACDLESKYRAPQTWQPLRSAIVGRASRVSEKWQGVSKKLVIERGE